MVPAGSRAAATAKARILLRRLSKRGKGTGNFARARGVVCVAGLAALIVPGSAVVAGIVYRRFIARFATSFRPAHPRDETSSPNTALSKPLFSKSVATVESQRQSANRAHALCLRAFDSPA